MSHLRCALLILGLLLSPAGRLRAQQAGRLDANFNPGFGVDGSVYALCIQPADGRVLVAGQFAAVNGIPRAHLARLHADGSLDASFRAAILEYGSGGESLVRVYTLALQPDGRLLIGGVFRKVGGQARVNLVRLHTDGSLDASFTPDLLTLSGVYRSGIAGVYALALQPDGRILVAGAFDAVGTATRRGVARLNADGTLDPSFDPARPQAVFPAQGLVLRHAEGAG